eukprot:NODE_21836_length_734_cov_7.172982.p1 GENE.NODE_21836_length_734_cov_7.172982~~NODE_21836_length_734_cov_7.172982.p1  ORF type:complete len:149 (+),score=13.97 NODE_21836_length_734_cov_7.172982:94-540(+)
MQDGKPACDHILWGTRDMTLFSSSSGQTDYEALVATSTNMQIMGEEDSSEPHAVRTAEGTESTEEARHAHTQRARPNKTVRSKLRRLVNSSVVVMERSLSSGACDQGSVRARYFQAVLEAQQKKQLETEAAAAAFSTECSSVSESEHI